MITLEIAFWLCFAVVLYAYVGYAVLIGILARIYRKPVHRQVGGKHSVSFVVCAHNEEGTIQRRLDELLKLIEESGLHGEVILVSDASSDGTAAIARSFAGDRLRVLDLPEHRGKAAALTAGAALSTNDILVFADTRQRWHKNALSMLLENFADPSVGAVSGDLIIESSPGVMAGVGLYWRFEKWLRKKESQVRSMISATGAICAVRRSLFRPIPDGLILDDVYWPLQVAMQGYRVVHDDRALAFDRLPEKARDEFQRKVRTLSGNFQLVGRLPAVLLPWRNPVWFEFISHKLLRLVGPWCLLGMLATSAAIDTPYYRGIFLLQVVSYLFGTAGFLRLPGHRRSIVSAASSFLVLNAAAWLAFWVWILGRTGQTWGKVTYNELPRKMPHLEKQAPPQAPMAAETGNLV